MRHARRHRHRLAVLLLVCGLAAAPAFAQPDRHGPPIFALRYAERLGLDADTQAKLEEIVSQSRARNEELGKRLHDARREMFERLEMSTPDEQAVMESADTVSAIEAEMEKNRLQAVLGIRTLLSPEQREELVRLVAEQGPRGGRDRAPPHRRGLGACREDHRQRCPGATDGLAVLACLQQHWNELSEACRTAFDFSRPPPPPPGHPGPPR